MPARATLSILRTGQPHQEHHHHENDTGELPPQCGRARNVASNVRAVGRKFDVARAARPVQAVQVIEDLRLVPAVVLPPAVGTRKQRRPPRLLRFPLTGFFQLVLLQPFAQQPDID